MVTHMQIGNHRCSNTDTFEVFILIRIRITVIIHFQNSSCRNFNHFLLKYFIQESFIVALGMIQIGSVGSIFMKTKVMSITQKLVLSN